LGHITIGWICYTRIDFDLMIFYSITLIYMSIYKLIFPRVSFVWLPAERNIYFAFRYYRIPPAMNM
jgi:hypothetical protein